MSSMESEARIKLEQWMLAWSNELKKFHVDHQALKEAHEVDICKYIDAATIEEINAKMFRESLVKVKK